MITVFNNKSGRVTTFIFLLSVFSFIGLSAQNFTPLEISAGLNADIIAEDSPRNQHTTNDVDNANYYFMSEDYPGANVGLPSSGTFISATTSNMPFELATYDANNSLRITNTGSGTLEFATPSAAERIYILVTSGSGTTSFTGTINFDDNTTQSISSQSVSDWFGGTTNVAISGIGRINLIR